MKARHSRFYIIITTLLLAVVVLGFGPRFFLRPFFEQPRHMQMDHLPIQFILHGTMMTTWYVLLVVQALLVNVRNIRLHMRLGWLLAVVAVLVVISAYPVMMGFAPRMLSLGFIDLEKPATLVPQAWMWYNDVMALLAFGVMVSIGI
jgi:hypothetical protein